MEVFIYSFILCMIVGIPTYFITKKIFRASIYLIPGLLTVVFLALVMSIAASIGSDKYSTSDYELLSGEVTKKEIVEDTKQESYSCNPTQSCSVINNVRSCVTVYQTCYRTVYTADWMVRSNIGSFNLKSKEEYSRFTASKYTPKLFDDTNIGDPVVKEKYFNNPFLTNNDSLYQKNKSLVATYLPRIPKYPDIYDHFKVNRVFNYSEYKLDDLSTKLNEMMKKLGPAKHINVIVFILKGNESRDYAEAINSSWLGGKKNDALVFIAVNDDGSISWSKVYSRSENSIFDKSIESDFFDNQNLVSTDLILKVISDNTIKHFKQMDLKKYEYLEQEHFIPTKTIVIALLIALINQIIAVTGFTYILKDN